MLRQAWAAAGWRGSQSLSSHAAGLCCGSAYSSTPAPPAQEEEATTTFGYEEVPAAEKAGRVGQVFSSVAPSYDLMNDLMSAGLHRLWKDRLVALLRPAPGVQHLDVAGGTGDVAFRLLRAAQLRAPSSSSSSSGSGSDSSSWANSGSSGGSGSDSSSWASSSSSGGVGGSSLSSSSGGSSGGDGAGVAGSEGEGVEGPETCITVCDINAAMLSEGQRRARALGLDRGLRWRLGDAERLEGHADGSVDSYSIAFGLRNVTRLERALQEAYRVLKPGGHFACLEFSEVTAPGLRDLYDLYSFNIIPQIGRFVAGDEASYRYLVESIRQFPGQEALAAKIRAAGFAGVSYENLAGGIVAIHQGFKLPSAQ